MDTWRRTGTGTVARCFGWAGLAGLAALLGIIGTGRTALAQDAKPPKAEEKLPKAEEVLDKSVEAMGGKAAFEQLRTRVIKGSIAVEGQDTKGPLTSYAAAPDKRYTVVELPSGGKIENGDDGEVHWQIVAGAPTVLQGDLRGISKREAAFHGVVNWRKLYQKAECVGVETVDEHPCFKLVLTPPEGEGSPELVYYDCKTYLPLKNVVTLKVPMGEATIDVLPTDFKKFDGILLPRKVTQTEKFGAASQTTTLTFDSIEHNVDIPAERFALPQPIKDLVAKSKAETKPAGEKGAGKKEEPKKDKP